MPSTDSTFLRSIFQDKEPYSKGAFKVAIDFPVEYPFKPPKITFLTKIYHPNVDEKGQVCLPIISPDNWKPATKTEQGEYYQVEAFLHDVYRKRMPFSIAVHYCKRYFVIPCISIKTPGH